MSTNLVSIVRYERPYESVKNAVLSCKGLETMPANSRVFIKPNIVFWTKAVDFPKWGAITTSRVIEDIVVLLKEFGVADITIGEGMICEHNDTETPAHAFKTLGYETLNRRYGVKFFNVLERPFKKVDLGDGITLNFNQDILNSDFIVNIPVMKTHNQTMVSFGLKNLKGVIDVPSRKKCHNPDLAKGLHYYIARLADKLPPMLTLIDGIYTLERGPGVGGKMRRSDLLVASADVLSADMVASRIIGHDPARVPHLAWAAKNRNRPLDLSDVEIVGETIEDVASFHGYDFEYVSNEKGEMPRPLAEDGIEGLFYRKFDETLCTYCTRLNAVTLDAIRAAWKGVPWNNIEVLNGKAMRPSPGMNATILLGQCMYRLNKDHPHINKMIAVKGCPPKPQEVVKALHEAGIEVDPAPFSQMETLPGLLMARYRGKPEFDESFFRIE